MQVLPHTQTAVNNFLGLHRFDAVFQILVGSWVSPEHHEFYANGNVLVSFLKSTDKNHLNYVFFRLSKLMNKGPLKNQTFVKNILKV